MTLRLPKAALLIALPIFAAPAVAQEQPTPPAPPAEETEQVEEKKICKRIEAQMGSRRKTKVCKTKEEWKAFNQEQRTRGNRRRN